MTRMGPEELQRSVKAVEEAVKQTFPNRINNTVICCTSHLDSVYGHPAVRVRWVLFNPDVLSLRKTIEMYAILPEFVLDTIENDAERIMQPKLNDVLLQLTKGIIAKDLTSLVDNLNEWDL